MASSYSQTFTLTEIFNDKRLRKQLPLVYYKEKELPSGKTSRTTRPKSVTLQVKETSRTASRPFYNPLSVRSSGNTITVGGTLIGDHDMAVDAVYNALMGIKQMLSFTANNVDLIRDALKEAEKSKAKYGISSKLWLRTQSIEEIMGMSKKQLTALMNNIMENIYYSDDFPDTQKKWDLANVDVGIPISYEQRKEQWKRRVGSL